MKRDFLAALIAATMVGFAASASTVNFNGGVISPDVIYFGNLTKTGLERVTGVHDGGSLMGADGFEWINPSIYGGSCQTDGIEMFTLDNNYDHVSCVNGVAVNRSDAARFSVNSINIEAQDFTRIAPPTPVLPDHSVRSISDPLYDSFYVPNADLLPLLPAGVVLGSPEAEAIRAARSAELKAAAQKQYDDYFAWELSSEFIKTDRFFAVGYRDGAEVVRQKFADTSGRTDVALSGFTDIDTIRFGYDHPGNFIMWNHYYIDNERLEVLLPSETFCSEACEFVRVFGMDYTLSSAGSDAGTEITPVPVPASLPLMALALGLVGWQSRRHG